MVETNVYTSDPDWRINHCERGQNGGDKNKNQKTLNNKFTVFVTYLSFPGFVGFKKEERLETEGDRPKGVTHKRKGRGRPKSTPGNDNAKVSSVEGVLNSSEVPEEAKLVALILKSMGVEEYEPNVIPQFLEFMHRYVTDVLQDSLIYAEHSGKGVLDLEDVRLAIQSRVNYSFTQPPPREVMLELAQRKNNIPLPFIPRYCTS